MLPTTLPAPLSTTLSLALLVYLCMNVGPHSLPVVRLPALFVLHSASLGNASALHPSCSSPPLLQVWMNVYFLFSWCWTSSLFDFLSVLVVRGGTVCLPTPPSWFSLVLLIRLLLKVRSYGICLSLPVSLPIFSHFPYYPQSNLALLVLIPWWVGLCTF